MITTSVIYRRSVTTVSLSELFAARDESLRVQRVSAWVRLAARIRRIDLAPARRLVMLVLLNAMQFMTRHALVLCGCAAIVVGAATISITAAWITAGAALFFLEARRR